MKQQKGGNQGVAGGQFGVFLVEKGSPSEVDTLVEGQVAVLL